MSARSVYQPVEGGWAVVGSMADATSHPDEYVDVLVNVLVDEAVTGEAGAETKTQRLVSQRVTSVDGSGWRTTCTCRRSPAPKTAGDREVPAIVVTSS